MFIMYFIPSWLLIDRGSEKHSFQGSALMSIGHDFTYRLQFYWEYLHEKVQVISTKFTKIRRWAVLKERNLIKYTNHWTTYHKQLIHQAPNHGPPIYWSIYPSTIFERLDNRYSFNPILHGGTHCARGRFFCLLWEHQGSWES